MKRDNVMPRPWSLRESYDNGEPSGYVINSGINLIADIESKANAELIVRAINRDHVFEELKNLLRTAQTDLEYLMDEDCDDFNGPESTVMAIKEILSKIKNGGKNNETSI